MVSATSIAGANILYPNWSRFAILARKGQISLKSSLSEEAWQWIKREGRSVTFVRGERLMTEGEPASHVYAIASGEVKALAESSSGHPVLLALIGPDQTIGVLSALDRGPREFTAVARNNVTAWILNRQQYGRMLTELPLVGAAQLEAVAARFRLSMRMSVERSDELACRISRQLQTMAADTGCRELALTQSELASWVGASREATGRCLARLRVSGAIATHRGGITILSTERLADFQVPHEHARSAAASGSLRSL
ncbi:MAG: Crp/Fnr family transcriptional regulator [Acidimicrobiales bacterium]|nr:Crp/Fnr family transcriptional regulator [Acidimicrobiales bacterium]